MLTLNLMLTKLLLAAALIPGMGTGLIYGASGYATVPTILHALRPSLSQFDLRFDVAQGTTTCSIPYVFTNGTVADASQVNADFNAVAGCVGAIYASSIVPTTSAQATFGGSIQYTFPAGVAVAGGQSNPLTTTAGSLWLSQNGTSPGTYALNLSYSNCGSTGSLQVINGTTVIATIDCQGNIASTQGSSIGANVQSNSGKITSPASTNIILCPGGCISGPNFTFTTAGVASFPGAIEGQVGTNGTGAPTALCYQASGTVCSSTWHTIIGTNGASITSCNANTLCSNQSTATFPFAFGTFPAGGAPFYCAYTPVATSGTPGQTIPVITVATTAGFTMQWYNAGANITSSFGTGTSWACSGF